VLGNASSSSEYLENAYKNYEGSGDDEKEYIVNVLLKEGLGVSDVSDDEVKTLRAHKADAQPIFADIISRRAQIGWSTHGHSGVDVSCREHTTAIRKMTDAGVSRSIFMEARVATGCVAIMRTPKWEVSFPLSVYLSCQYPWTFSI
jgi:hypothetical protein